MIHINQKWIRYSAMMSGAVSTKVALIYLGYLAGSALDTHFGTYPFIMFFLIVLGSAIGIWWVIYCSKRYKVS